MSAAASAIAVRSEPPRPRVVIWPSSSIPWKPATMTTRLSFRSRRTSLRVHHLDLRLRVDLVGEDAGLGPRVADGRHSDPVERHGHERDRLLLADREQLVELALARLRAQALGPGDQLVGDPGARRKDDDDLVALRRARP